MRERKEHAEGTGFGFPVGQHEHEFATLDFGARVMGENLKADAEACKSSRLGGRMILLADLRMVGKAHEFTRAARQREGRRLADGVLTAGRAVLRRIPTTASPLQAPDGVHSTDGGIFGNGGFHADAGEMGDAGFDGDGGWGGGFGGK